ncbi:MAG: hypothetical protein ACQESP_00970 [Candidatus Muiribacteriota bacterium]
MKKRIFVFIAVLGSIYSLFFTQNEEKIITSQPRTEIIENEKNSEKVDKNIVSYKGINIHAPVVKDFDNFEIIGIDRKEMPVVYYKFENTIKTARVNDKIGEVFKVEDINNNKVKISNILNDSYEYFEIK